MFHEKSVDWICHAQDCDVLMVKRSFHSQNQEVNIQTSDQITWWFVLFLYLWDRPIGVKTTVEARNMNSPKHKTAIPKTQKFKTYCLHLIKTRAFGHLTWVTPAFFSSGASQDHVSHLDPGRQRRSPDDARAPGPHRAEQAAAAGGDGRWGAHGMGDWALATCFLVVFFVFFFFFFSLICELWL